MGENMPEVGERVVYHVAEGSSVFAHVVRVEFWDLVDLQLEDGTLVAKVRRVVVLDWEPVTRIGRFDRI